MARMKRILMAVHPYYRPDVGPRRISTEYDVWTALKRMGHHVQIAGVADDLGEFERTVSEFQPHIVFNLLEEFRGEAVYDFHPVSLLEAMGVPFTGCNPRGLVLSRNKYLTGLIASSLGIRIPKSWIVKSPKSLRAIGKEEFPLFVKLNREHASLGIRESNRVTNAKALSGTCQRLWESFGSEIIIQKFIPGIDVTVSVWGNGRSSAFAPMRVKLGGKNRVSTASVKFSPAAWSRRKIRSVKLRSDICNELQRDALTLYRHLEMSGYARFDFRVDENSVAYLIDINANPNLSKDEDFVISSGLPYLEVLARILELGIDYRPNI